MNFIYVELGESKLSKEQLEKFDCGNKNFNLFLHDQAKEMKKAGLGVTYILLSKDEYEEYQKNPETCCIKRIYAFATISTTAVVSDSGKERLYIPCAEIKLFAIAKSLQGQIDKNNNYYSDIFFKILLQDLYIMSMNTIGFKMILLFSNDCGRKLYEKNNFVPIRGYMVANVDEKIEIENCEPMYMVLNDENIYAMFLSY